VKAWDILKEKSFNIDLVLTEVELPLMSGFLLLSTIMEHDASKNIPVISMSLFSHFHYLANLMPPLSLMVFLVIQ
jgi:PleD family two-component response regulator